ncbi:ATP-binding protein [Cellvibrio mixtus]|uniref:ATP-binding protein n=1 Tax=Cellvibrio mixtus TaxID=39650 RepID=A0A266Q786_9GAMM|nr:DUF2062 domain-containing protein [Cellvibrio mixtus]OZY85747.1 ATP-binding protein [Cellvibrio mixtus]
MARNLLKRFIPTPAAIKNTPGLHFLGDLLHDPNLFHLNRHSVSVAMFWGLFVALLPIPGQMPVAAAAALIFRCNLPLSVALTWITNPVTMPFFFFITYQMGRLILQTDPINITTPELSWDWLANEFGHLWKPLLAGSVITGLLFGALGYGVMQLYWRWHVNNNWKKRKKMRAQKAGQAL